MSGSRDSPTPSDGLYASNMAKVRHHRLAIPDTELRWRFSRSSGPGGQSVNTTDSRVELSWDVGDTTVLTPAEKVRALEALRGRISGGVVTVTGSQYRSQHRNREDAKVRLETLVTWAVIPPRKRRATKPSKGAQQRGMNAKKQRSETKRLRQRP